MNLISNCPLCGEHSLHVIGEGAAETQQCINCGYVSAEKFKYDDKKENNEEYNKLPEDMKNWSKDANSRVWIPTIMTLPMGMLYPIDVDNPVNHQKEMKWALALMIDIPEDKREEFPIEGQEGKFYERMYDVENHEVFDEFVLALSKVNNIFKEQSQGQSQQPSELKLPKLKKL